MPDTAIAQRTRRPHATMSTILGLDALVLWATTWPSADSIVANVVLILTGAATAIVAADKIISSWRDDKNAKRIERERTARQQALEDEIATQKRREEWQQESQKRREEWQRTSLTGQLEALRKQLAEATATSQDNQSHTRDSLHAIRDEANGHKLEAAALREELRQATQQVQETTQQLHETSNKFLAAQQEIAELRRQIAGLPREIKAAVTPQPGPDTYPPRPAPEDTR
jgi:chromosome segregation ATPase